VHQSSLTQKPYIRLLYNIISMSATSYVKKDFRHCDSCSCSETQQHVIDWVEPKDDASRLEIPPGRCGTVGDQRVDPLVAAAHYNLTQNPFCRLPEELLVEVIGLLDKCSVECLRRVSRVFLRLCVAAFPKRYDHSPLSSPWPEHNGSFSSYRQQDRLASLLNRNRYCGDGQRAREAPDWQERVDKATKAYLHCSKCCLHHPSCLFSATQRLNPPRTRICIGHEWFLRLCSHEVARWSDIASIERESAGESSITVTRCDRKSHVATCKSKSKTKYKGIDSDAHPKLSLHIWNACRTINLTWEAHVRLAAGQKQHLTEKTIRNGLAELRRNTARFIGPESKPGRLVELLWFDPNHCDCVRFEGSDLINWQLAPSETLQPHHCRRTQRKHRPTEKQVILKSHIIPEKQSILKNARRVAQWLGLFRHKDEPPLQMDQHGNTETHVSNMHKHGITETHFGRTQFDRRSLGLHSSEVVVSPCCNGDECLTILYQRRIDLYESGCLQSMSSHWYQVLDPDSYNLTNDRDGLGVYWCRQEGCGIYYRYALSRMLQQEGYSQPCSRPCQ
jgi:hypothetical protein